MSKKRALEVRIIVGSENGPCSSVWRVWSSRNEIYVAWGNLGHVEKISFHSEKGGIRTCRKAFTTERGTPKVLPDRATIKWQRWDSPAAGEGQGICVLEAAFPTDYLSSVKKLPAKAVTWIIPAPSGMATVLEMLFTREPETELRKLMGNERVVTYTSLPNGEAFVLAQRSAIGEQDDFYVDASQPDDESLIFSARDDGGTGRPIRFAAFSSPRNGDRMYVWEFGGYKGKKPNNAKFGVVERQTVLDKSAK